MHGNQHSARVMLPESSEELSVGTALLQNHAHAVLTSILPVAPSQSEVNSLARAFRVVRKAISPFVSFDLDPLYKPPRSVIENWVRGASSQFRDGPQFSEPPRDIVRDKVNTTNTTIAEAMHARTGAVESEQVRHRAMIKVFLRAMRAGGIDLLKIKLAFDTIDEDRSGRVDRTEFINAMSLLGLHLSTIQIGSLFDAVDIDDSGDLSIDEFVDAITGTVGRNVCDLVTAVGNSDRVASRGRELDMRHQKEVKEAVTTVIKRIKVLLAQKSFQGGTEAALMELFMKSDVDHSGSVSKHEFQLALENLGLDLKKTDVDAILKVSDADKTGELEYWEFVRLLREPRKAKISRSDTIGEGVGGVPVFGVKQYVVVLLKLLIWFIGTCVIGFWFVRVVFLVCGSVHIALLPTFCSSRARAYSVLLLPPFSVIPV
jgi:Ca2+-binding EF-hand superfamily protein